MRRDNDRRRNSPTVPPSRPERPRERVSTPGNTFRVAQAQRVLARDLPQVVYHKAAPKPDARREPPCVGCAQEAAKASISKPAMQARRDDLTPARSQPMLHKPAPTCKGKPSERQSKRGGGAGRSYVPWCGGSK